jgi:predicted aminopeptidase
MTLLAACALSGCGAPYLLQAARGQAELMSLRMPLERAIEEAGRRPGDAAASRRQALERLRDAREFAVRKLALPDNDSYRSFADLERPFAVWSVVATPEFSVAPRRWCFPVAGCVAYRGYFRERAARTYAARLARRGDDVTVGGVPAYSTLGRFADPLVSPMLRLGVDDAVATLFHELAHQVVYVQDDTAFNEAFAVTVERAGFERWLAYRGEPASPARLERALRQQRFVRAVERARRDLAVLYARPLDAMAMRVAKQARLAELTVELRALEAESGTRAGFSRWLETGLNNAHLASVASYWQCVAGFERELAAVGGDLPLFYARVRELALEPAAARRARLCEPAPR